MVCQRSIGNGSDRFSGPRLSGGGGVNRLSGTGVQRFAGNGSAGARGSGVDRAGGGSALWYDGGSEEEGQSAKWRGGVAGAIKLGGGDGDE